VCAQSEDIPSAGDRLRRCLELERSGDRDGALRACRAVQRAEDATPEQAEAARKAAWRVRSYRVRYGPIAGLRLATMSGDPSEEYDPRFGFMLGAAATAPLGCILALMGELSVAKRGTYGKNERAETVNVDLVYADVAVFLRAGVERPSAMIPYVFGGALVSMLLSAEGQAEGHPQQDLADVTDPFSIAGVIGGGVRFPTGVGDFTADLRYEHGLNGVLTVNVLHYEFVSSRELRHRALSLNGGFLF
jgi:hypothetical protein